MKYLNDYGVLLPIFEFQNSIISGYDYYQFEMSKDDGMEEWRTNLKNVFKKTSTTINQSVLFLYETQVFNFIKIIVKNRNTNGFLCR